MLARINLIARKIHRLCVALIVLLGIPMTATGLTMRYPTLSPLNWRQARLLHGQLSTIFGAIFLIMMITGIVLYLTPWIVKLTRKPTPPV